MLPRFHLVLLALVAPTLAAGCIEPPEAPYVSLDPSLDHFSRSESSYILWTVNGLEYDEIEHVEVHWGPSAGALTSKERGVLNGAIPGDPECETSKVYCEYTDPSNPEFMAHFPPMKDLDRIFYEVHVVGGDSNISSDVHSRPVQ